MLSVKKLFRLILPRLIRSGGEPPFLLQLLSGSRSQDRIVKVGRIILVLSAVGVVALVLHMLDILDLCNPSLLRGMLDLVAGFLQIQ